MRINKDKGFTLIELLGVIVILSVIIMITVPLVQDKIEESRKDAFVASVDGYLRATRIKNTEEGITEFTVADESITPSVEYRGEIQGEGSITYDNLGKAKVNIWNGKYCAVKSYQDSSVQLVSDVDNYEACMRR